RRTQPAQSRIDVEARLLAFGEVINRGLHLRLVEPQRMHDGARRCDLLLRYPAIRLGDVAHEAKGGRKEQLIDECRIGWPAEHTATEKIRGGAGIKLMADENTEHGPEWGGKQHAEGSADDLPAPLHLGNGSSDS